MPEIRVGQGFDVHPFSDDPGRRLVLGGVVFDGQGLAGHSDADVVAHAVTDALLGAAGLGDIGQRYPDTDPVHAGVDSMGLLADSVAAANRACVWEEHKGEDGRRMGASELEGRVVDSRALFYERMTD